MNRERIAYLIASVIGIIAAYFPFAAVLTGAYRVTGQSAISFDVIIIFGMITALAVSGEIQKPLNRLSRITSLILALIPIISLLVMVIRYQSSWFSFIPVSFQLGAYLMILASLLVITIVILSWKQRQIKTEHVYDVQRVVIILAAAVGLVASFFPFAKTGEVFQSSLQANYTTAGLIIFLLFLLSLIAASMGGVRKPMKNWHLAASVAPGVIPAIIINMLWLKNMSLDFTTPAINFEFGFYFMLVASLVIFVLGLNVRNKPVSS